MKEPPLPLSVIFETKRFTSCIYYLLICICCIYYKYLEIERIYVEYMYMS